MDVVQVACPECARDLRVPRSYLGSRGTCHHCGNIVCLALPQAAQDRLPEQLDEMTQRAGGAQDLLQSVLCSFFSTKSPMRDEMRASWAVAFLADHEAQGLRLACTSGHFSAHFRKEESFVPFGECLCGKAAQSGEMVMAQDYRKDDRRMRQWLGLGGRGFYAIPLKAKGDVLGVIGLSVPDEAKADHLPLLAQMGEQVGGRLRACGQVPSPA